MERLEGMDIDIETSLKEYGLAWQSWEDETVFYYGIAHDGEEYTRFDWGTIDNDTDIKNEYDWANFQDVAETMGMTITEWDKTPLTQKIWDLLSFYGYENVFGASHTEGQTYEEITE